MNTKEFKVGDRVQRTAREILKGMVLQIKDYKGTVVQVRDCEPSLGVIWDGYTKIYWYITSSGIFQKIDDDISDEDKDLVTNIINNVNTMNSGLVSVEEITSAWKKVVKELESEGELKLRFNCAWKNVVEELEDEGELRLEDDDIKVGDRVRCVCSDDFGILEAGKEGTVIIIEKPEPSIGVRWDNYHEEKHDLYGNCEDGYGFWISKNHIKKIENSDESGELKIDVIEDKSIAEEIVDDFERMVQRISYTKTEDVNKNQVLSPKEMLKAGMVVEMADGDFGLFDGERILYHDGFDEIAGLDDDLQDIYVSHKMDVYDTSDEFSIVAIYQPTCGYTLQTLNIKVGKFKVIWKKEGFVRKVKKEFSKDELVILKRLCDDGYEYIARNKDGNMCALCSEGLEKLEVCWWCGFGYGKNLEYMEDLFRCISWEDKEPTRILDFI